MDLKKVVIIVAVLFVGFWMFNDPSGLAQLTKDGAGKALDLGGDLFTALIDFIKQFT
ncbi:MAG TPA: hypothetical protein VGJ41_06225 [Nocardioides sp.]|jgi:hypothetical protein